MRSGRSTETDACQQLVSIAKDDWNRRGQSSYPEDPSELLDDEIIEGYFSDHYSESYLLEKVVVPVPFASFPKPKDNGKVLILNDNEGNIIPITDDNIEIVEFNEDTFEFKLFKIVDELVCDSISTSIPSGFEHLVPNWAKECLGISSAEGTEEQKTSTFGYYINLDERGSFFADVRNINGDTVYEIKAGNELPEDCSSIFEDGYMKNKWDIAGLTEYLIEICIIPKNAEIMGSNDFEEFLEEMEFETSIPRL